MCIYIYIYVCLLKYVDDRKENEKCIVGIN